MSDFVSLGASWVFSLQPVLPPVSQPLFPSIRRKRAKAINAVTETRLWALLFFSSWEDFDFMLPPGIAAVWLLCNGLYTSPFTHR
jgi:hypothetical protein